MSQKQSQGSKILIKELKKLTKNSRKLKTKDKEILLKKVARIISKIEKDEKPKTIQEKGLLDKTIDFFLKEVAEPVIETFKTTTIPNAIKSAINVIAGFALTIFA